MEDGTQTGFAADPSKRRDVFGLFGIAVESRLTEAADPMSTPPPAHLAEEQLAEFRALMGGQEPPNPAND